MKTENPSSLQSYTTKPHQPLVHPKPYPKAEDTLPLSHVKTETVPLSHAKTEQTHPLSHNRPTIAAADSSNILHVLSPEHTLT